MRTKTRGSNAVDGEQRQEKKRHPKRYELITENAILWYLLPAILFVCIDKPVGLVESTTQYGLQYV